MKSTENVKETVQVMRDLIALINETNEAMTTARNNEGIMDAWTFHTMSEAFSKTMKRAAWALEYYRLDLPFLDTSEAKDAFAETEG